MNEHLSARQIDEWLIGERVPAVAAHLQTCDVCAEELRRFTETLRLFGEVITQASTGERPLSRKPESLRWPALLLAVAALLAIVAVPLYHRGQLKNQAAQDEILLQQVESHIAQSVPAPMEPLAKLMRQDLP